MLYNDPSWAGVHDVPRRTIRGTYRDEFFNAFGKERLTDPFKWNPEGKANLEHVLKLLDHAQSMHLDEKSALDALRSQIAMAALGTGGLGPSGTLTYGAQLVSRLLKDHFSLTEG